MLLRAPTAEATILRACKRLIRVTHGRRPPRARRYIPASLGVRGFCESLEASGLRYVVLRWFDRLPEVAPGEDLDLLIADDALGEVNEFFGNAGSRIPCDLYTCSGLPGTEYHEMAYYPPHLAERILERSVLRDGWCRVPCPEDHFFSLAYHALYHKGPLCGLPTSTSGASPVTHPEHDYTSTLSQLATALGMDARVTMEDLDDLLAERGWRPPLDTLERLAAGNIWIDRRLRASTLPIPQHESGLTIFFLRREAIDAGYEKSVVQILSDWGFNLLLIKPLSDDERLHLAPRIRGGNWGRGPCPTSGGEPAMVIATCDLNPRPVSAKIRRRSPWLQNARILEVKTAIREQLNRLRPREKWCNMLHSSDNDHQAWEYLRLAIPGHEQEVRQQLSALHQRYATPVPVLRDLTRFGRRAKVELTEQDGRLVVRKTFRPGKERFYEREVAFMRRFSKLRSEVPELIETNCNSFVIPYYEDQLDRHWRKPGILPAPLLPLHVARQMVEVLHFFHAEGYGLIDLCPNNVLYSRRDGMKLIDFEFALEYANTLPFDQCYAFAGVPEDFEGDLPHMWRREAAPYELYWKPYIGLPLRSLLFEPTWLQVTRRAVYQVRRLFGLYQRRVSRRVRSLMSARM